MIKPYPKRTQSNHQETIILSHKENSAMGAHRKGVISL